MTLAEPQVAPIIRWVAGHADDEQILASFAKWQRGRNFSRHTIRRRECSLNGFLTFVAPVQLADVTPELIDEWIGTRRAPRTKHAYRSDLAALFTWAVRRRLVTENPVAETDSIRVPRSLPRPVDPALIRGVIAAATDPDTKLMVALAAYAGLRRAEITRLQTSDVSLIPPMLTVRDGKGSKDRTVPLHPALVSMFQIRRVAGPLFHVSPGTVGRRVANHLAACGIDATCHQLRHSFGTELARVTNGNLPLVRQLMGHDDVNTTMGYIGWSGEGAAPIAAMYGGHRL